MLSSAVEMALKVIAVAEVIVSVAIFALSLCEASSCRIL